MSFSKRFVFHSHLLLLMTIALTISFSMVIAEADDEPPTLPARLLVHKNVETKYLIENQDIVINYRIFNVGGRPATNVQINDNSLPKEYFEWFNQTNQFQIPIIQPKQQEIRTLIYKPKTGVWGQFNFTFAEVHYRTEGESEPLFGMSTEPGYGYIFSTVEYDRRFNFHWFDWILFSLLTIPSLGFPFYLWWGSKSKYEKLAKKE